MKKPIRVLHSVNTYLNISENWIYPQITSVDDIYGGVLSRWTANQDQFPLGDRPLILERSEDGMTFRRIFDGVAKRLGRDKASMSLLAARWKPDVIHAHFGARGYEALELKKRLGVPLITSFYGVDAWKEPDNKKVWVDRNTQLFKDGDRFLVEGPAMKARLVELGCASNKIDVHRLGVDISKLEFRKKDFSGDLKVAMLGRFVEKKGLPDGLRACAEAIRNGANLAITVIGDAGADSESGQLIKKELLELADGPDLQGKVNFAGFVPLDQTRKILAEQDIFLCPSKHASNGDAEGGSPVALTEAMAMGLLCIGTDHCDIPEVIVASRTGHLCKQGDISALADALSSVASKEQVATEMTIAGREHIETKFSIHKQLADQKSIYESMARSSDPDVAGVVHKSVKTHATKSNA